MRDNECNSETKTNGLEVRLEKGHLAPEVKITNEIVCNQIWIIGLPLGGKRRETIVTTFGGETISLGFMEQCGSTMLHDKCVKL
jgi:hypothetical protein